MSVFVRPVARRTLGIPGSIGLLFAFIVLWGLQHSWKVTFGFMFERIASVRILRGHPFGFMRGISKAVYNGLGRGVAWAERGWVWCLNAVLELPLLIVGTVAAVAYLGWELSHKQKDYATKREPTTIDQRQQQAIVKLKHQLAALAATVAALPHIKTNTGAKTAAPSAPITLHDWQVLRRGIDRLRGRVGALEAEIGTVTKPQAVPRAKPAERVTGRSHAWWKVMTKPAAVALAATAITSLGLNWIRCRKVGKIGRGLCGMPASLFAFLFEFGTLAFLLSDVCKLVTAMQRVAVAFEPALVAFVNEIGGYVCGGKGSAPSGIVDSDWQQVSRLPTGI